MKKRVAPENFAIIGKLFRKSRVCPPLLMAKGVSAVLEGLKTELDSTFCLESCCDAISMGARNTDCRVRPNCPLVSAGRASTLLARCCFLPPFIYPVTLSPSTPQALLLEGECVQLIVAAQQAHVHDGVLQIAACKALVRYQIRPNRVPRRGCFWNQLALSTVSRLTRAPPSLQATIFAAEPTAAVHALKQNVLEGIVGSALKPHRSDSLVVQASCGALSWLIRPCGGDGAVRAAKVDLPTLLLDALTQLIASESFQGVRTEAFNGCLGLFRADLACSQDQYPERTHARGR